MRRASERTTAVRVIAALAFAFVLPSLVLGQTYIWLDHPKSGPPLSAQPGLYTGVSLIFGVMLGWPYVAGAAGLWAILDHLDRHYRWTSAVVGLATGAAVVLLTARDGQVSGYPIAYPLYLGLGLLTGLGVWQIAYGRQARLPRPGPPARQRLVL